MTGVLLMESGDYPEAVRQLQQAAAQDPQSTFVASLLAEALFLADRPKDAEEAANRAIKLDGASGQAYLIRGEARRAQKNFDDAIEDYRRAMAVQEFGSGVFRTAAFWAIGTGMRKHRSGTQFLYRSQKASAYYGLCAAEIGRDNYSPGNQVLPKLPGYRALTTRTRWCFLATVTRASLMTTTAAPTFWKQKAISKLLCASTPTWSKLGYYGGS